MKDLGKVDAIQARRIMIRFDWPEQELRNVSADEVEKALNTMFSRWHWIAQLEHASRLHVQGYLESKTGSPIRLGSVVRAIRKQTDHGDDRVSVYVAPARRKAEKCVSYVTKDRTAVLGPWSDRPMEDWPKSDGDKQRIDRSDLYSAVMEDQLTMSQIMADPDMAVAASSCSRWLAGLIRQRDGEKWSKAIRDVQTIYIYGDSNTGKSQASRDWLHSRVGDDYYAVDDYQRDPWGSYAMQRGLLLDDLRLPTPQIGLQTFLRMTDRYPFELSRRYENLWAAYNIIVIASNWSPIEQWQAIESSAPLGAKPKDEDCAAFYRRLSRVLHISGEGTIEDQTDAYRGDVKDRKKITAAQIQHVLNAPVPPSLAQISSSSKGLNVVAEGRSDTIQDAWQFAGL